MHLQLDAEAARWQAIARRFADEELKPWEVEAELNGGRIPPEQRLTVAILWGDNEIACTAHDLSATGMCVAVAPDRATRLADVERVRLRFRIPGLDDELFGPARVLHRTPLVGRVLFGLEFDLHRPDGIGRRARELARYVQRRCEELARWELALRGSRVA